MCEPVTLGLLASAGTYGGLASAGMIGTSAAVTAGTASMTALQAISLAATIGSTAMSAGAMYQQGQVAEATARNNATMAEYAAQDAQRRGEEEAAAIQRKGAALKSSQRVALAAKGLDLTYGSAGDLQDQTDFFTQSDVATARTNAGREVWNYRAQGQQSLAKGRADALNASLQATGTLLGSAGQVADKWYSYSGKSNPGLPDWYTNPASTRYRGGNIGSWYSSGANVCRKSQPTPPTAWSAPRRCARSFSKPLTSPRARSPLREGWARWPRLPIGSTCAMPRPRPTRSTRPSPPSG